MTGEKITVLTHGGAGSKEEYKDGADQAARKGLKTLEGGGSVMDAVCLAVEVLENDSRFNAGIGSRLRSDGSVQMDAAVMDSTGRFGAVAVVEGFRNPVHIARAVSQSEYRLLAGRGAGAFAKDKGFETFDPRTAVPAPPGPEASDTVGAVCFDGEAFAAALSTGGTPNALPGRVGDVPLIGCGLYAGPDGAVAATGNGEAIAMNLTAIRAYRLIEKKMSPQAILKEVIGWFPPEDSFGLLLVTREGWAGGSNRTMAWAAISG